MRVMITKCLLLFGHIGTIDTTHIIRWHKHCEQYMYCTPCSTYMPLAGVTDAHADNDDSKAKIICSLLNGSITLSFYLSATYDVRRRNQKSMPVLTTNKNHYMM